MAVDQVLKRHFWIVVLPMTALAAFLGASGVTQIAGAALSVDAKQLAAPPTINKAIPMAAAGDHPMSADPILARNPFDSVTGPLNRVAVADGGVGGDQPVDTSDPYNAPTCDGVKILIIAQSADPAWSFAALSSGGPDAKSQLRRKGGDFGGKKVEYVSWDRVWLSNNGALCQAQLFQPEAPPKAAAAPPVASENTRGGPPGVDPAISKGIQRVSATEFNIDRSVVDKILENQADLMKQARIVPEQENGKLVGIRLFGVRQDTLLGVLGMENGDRLQTINGFDMTSPEKALEAYARLRTADHLTVQINRKGANTNLDYNIK